MEEDCIGSQETQRTAALEEDEKKEEKKREDMKKEKRRRRRRHYLSRPLTLFKDSAAAQYEFI
jgi:hypothetical protein